MSRKPKSNRRGQPELDRCQTPPYALEPLLPYVPNGATIWEPAAGKGNLVRALRSRGHSVIATDLDIGVDFFHCDPPPVWDMIITNPPYSLKYEWLARCYALGKPFALLVPIDTLAATSALRLFMRYGHEQLLLHGPRVCFEMPRKGYDGRGAQFATFWLCWQVLGQPCVIASMTRRKEQEVVASYLPELLPRNRGSSSWSPTSSHRNLWSLMAS